MSGIDWNGILRLPEAALAGCRRIPKTVLVKHGGLDLTPGCIDRARAARGEGPLAG